MNLENVYDHLLTITGFFGAVLVPVFLFIWRLAKKSSKQEAKLALVDQHENRLDAAESALKEHAQLIDSNATQIRTEIDGVEENLNAKLESIQSSVNSMASDIKTSHVEHEKTFREIIEKLGEIKGRLGK